MRVPKIIKYNKSGDNVRVEKISNIIPISYKETIKDDKSRIKLIHNIENIVRSSEEYKLYVAYLKEYIDMTKCHYFNNISNKNDRAIKIEIHHHPFTLFDITETVLNRSLFCEEDINELMLADEVMKIHYRGEVGLIPLSETVHELAHSGNIFIPINYVYGDFNKFIEKYESFIPKSTQKQLSIHINMSKSYVEDLSVLEKQFVYLDVDGMSFPDISNLKIRESD